MIRKNNLHKNTIMDFHRIIPLFTIVITFVTGCNSNFNKDKNNTVPSNHIYFDSTAIPNRQQRKVIECLNGVVRDKLTYVSDSIHYDIKNNVLELISVYNTENTSPAFEQTLIDQYSDSARIRKTAWVQLGQLPFDLLRESDNAKVSIRVINKTDRGLILCDIIFPQTSHYLMSALSDDDAVFELQLQALEQNALVLKKRLPLFIDKGISLYDISFNRNNSEFSYYVQFDGDVLFENSRNDIVEYLNYLQTNMEESLMEMITDHSIIQMFSDIGLSLCVVGVDERKNVIHKSSKKI